MYRLGLDPAPSRLGHGRESTDGRGLAELFLLGGWRVRETLFVPRGQ